MMQSFLRGWEYGGKDKGVPYICMPSKASRIFKISMSGLSSNVVNALF